MENELMDNHQSRQREAPHSNSMACLHTYVDEAYPVPKEPPVLDTDSQKDGEIEDGLGSKHKTSKLKLNQSGVLGAKKTKKRLYGVIGDEADGMSDTLNELRVWDDRDIEQTEYPLYWGRLLKQARNHHVIKAELLLICRQNYISRVKCVCDFLCKEKKIKLNSPLLEGLCSESPLHTALLFVNTNLAEVLMNYGGRELILKQYTHPDYQGMTALHLAIVKGTRCVICKMIAMLNPGERDGFLHVQARGNFFVERYSGNGLPLTLAAWSGQYDIINDLLDNGCQLDAVDSRTGNNVFHALVEYSLSNATKAIETYQFILGSQSTKEWWANKNDILLQNITQSKVIQMKNYLLRQENFAGFTPLSLSARLNACQMFVEIIQTEDVYKHSQWSYGPAVFTNYDVSEVDTAVGKGHKPSAIDLFVYTISDDQLAILATQPIKSVIESKWKAYQGWFYASALVHVVMVALLTHCVLYNTPQNEGQLLNDTQTVDDVISQQIPPMRRPFQYTLLGIIIITILSDIYDLLRNITNGFSQKLLHRPSPVYKIYWSSMFKSTIFRPVLLIFCTTALTWLVSDHINHKFSNLFGGLAMGFGWYYTLFFTCAWKNVGMFTVIHHKILTTDFLHFVIVFFLVLISFTTMLMSTYLNTNYLQSMPTAMWTLIRLACGLIDLEPAMDQSEYPVFVRVVILAFILFATVQLLNLLIAAMNDTYSCLSKNKELMWTKLIADAIMIIERRIPFFMRPRVPLKKRTVFYDEGGNGKSYDMWLLPVEEVACCTKAKGIFG